MWLSRLGPGSSGRHATSLQDRDRLDHLTAVAEWALVRDHSAHGESIVLGFDPLREIAPIVRHHHERFDGQGYPDGLQGDAIPLEARIVAAADTYAAITTDRGYRPARSSDEGLDELRRAAGKQLVPASSMRCSSSWKLGLPWSTPICARPDHAPGDRWAKEVSIRR